VYSAVPVHTELTAANVIVICYSLLQAVDGHEHNTVLMLSHTQGQSRHCSKCTLHTLQQAMDVQGTPRARLL
jgi:hypothetical protein